jgi:hypothetical protein
MPLIWEIFRETRQGPGFASDGRQTPGRSASGAPSPPGLLRHEARQAVDRVAEEGLQPGVGGGRVPAGDRRDDPH